MIKQQVKRLDFRKGDHYYSVYYDDIKEFINHMVDYCDADDNNLDMMDMLSVVRNLARIEGKNDCEKTN